MMILLEILEFIGGCTLVLMVLCFIGKIGENKVTEKRVDEWNGGNRNA